MTTWFCTLHDGVLVGLPCGRHHHTQCLVVVQKLSSFCALGVFLVRIRTSSSAKRCQNSRVLCKGLALPCSMRTEKHLDILKENKSGSALLMYSDTYHVSKHYIVPRVFLVVIALLLWALFKLPVKGDGWLISVWLIVCRGAKRVSTSASPAERDQEVRNTPATFS